MRGGASGEIREWIEEPKKVKEPPTSNRIYTLRRLTEADLMMAHRRGKRCGQSCDAPLVYLVRSESRVGQGGRGSRRQWYVCAVHGQEFAARHDVKELPARF